MTIIRDFDEKCPVCGNTSPQPALMSTNCWGYPDLDLRPAPMQRDTMNTWVLECPHCGYVCKNFKKDTTITEEFLKSEEYLTCDGFEFKENLASRFYRNYLIGKKEKNTEKCFDSLLYCAWSCDDNGDINAAHIRKLSIPYITELIDADDNDKSNLFLMKADILRRCGEFDRLIEEYSNITPADDTARRIIEFQIAKAREHDTACYTVEDVIGPSEI